MPTVPDPIVYTQNLRKVFGRRTAVADLTLTVPAGTVFGLVGPNGSGKTTSIKMLLGLIRPTDGQAWVMDGPPAHPASRQRVGYLPELFRYPAWMRVEEVLAFHARLLGRVTPADIERVLRRVGLLGRQGQRVGALSKGLQQRLGLAVALLGEPALLFLDEPTSAMDPLGRMEVRELIAELRQAGVTVFLNSHLLAEVEQVCDQVAAMDGGRVVASGPLSQWLAGEDLWVRASGREPWLTDQLTALGGKRHGDRWWVLPGADDALAARLARLVVNGGGQLYALERRRPTLEQRFREWVEAAGPPKESQP